jgi:hypothetical protein
MTVLQGMAVHGANGASPDQLRRVAQMALRAWPKRRIQELIGPFQRTNRIALGLPMWNFSIPYKLKHLSCPKNGIGFVDAKDIPVEESIL